MCAAHEEIDKIHESEVKARERIKDAEKRANAIKDEADKEAKALMAKAEHDARKTATKMLSEIEGKKSEIESSIFKETDQKMKVVRETANKRKAGAEKIAYKILLEED